MNKDKFSMFWFEFIKVKNEIEVAHHFSKFSDYRKLGYLLYDHIIKVDRYCFCAAKPIQMIQRLKLALPRSLSTDTYLVQLRCYYNERGRGKQSNQKHTKVGVTFIQKPIMLHYLC